MAITTNETVQFNISNISDNQILVYDANIGAFVNEVSAVSANASVTGLGRNIGSQGVGIYAQNDEQYLEFYKLQAGSNTTISLNDNVITIDAVVGSGNTSLGSGNANTIALFDANGNVINGSDSLTYNGTTFSFLGENNNVTIADGLITADNVVATNFSFANGNVTLPTADGVNGQVLATDGNGTLSFVNRTDISNKLDSVTFNAHVAQAMVTTGDNAPALNNTYDLGNSTNKYSQIYSTYFRGTADLAVNAQNLGSIAASEFSLANAVYTRAQVDVLIGNIDSSNTSGLLSNVFVTNGSNSYTQDDGNIDIRGDGNVTVDIDNINKRVNLGLNSNIVTRAFRQVSDGTTNVVAETGTDTLTLAGGTGISVVADANSDTLTISATGSAQANVSNTSIGALVDVASVAGISDGQALLWNAANSQFEYGNVVASGGGNSNVQLTDFSVTTATPSGNGSLAYDNAGVFTFTPANVQATTQSLTWDSANSNLSISGGNTVDLSTLLDDTDQNLSLAGNVITISGSNSNVDLTSALGNVAGNYSDSNVASYLSTNNYSNVSYGNAEVQAYLDAQNYSNVDSDAQSISISGNVISISGNASTVDLTSALANATDLSGYATTTSLTTANTNMQAYVDDLESRIIGGANVNLDSLAEVANALANSNTELSTVAFTGTYSDLTSKPTLALSGNTYLTFDSANIDLSSVVGVQGDQGIQGNAGADGVSVSSASLSGDNLQITLSNATVLTAGNVRGPVGPQGNVGPQGDGNAGVSSATVNGSGNLVITLNDSTTVDAGNVKGADGSQGIQGNAGVDGISITNTQLVSDNLVVTYSNTSTSDLGNIRGPVGPQGNAGIDGADGIQLSNLSVTTASASGNGSLAYDNSTGVFTFTPANVSPSYGNAEVQAYLDAQNYSNVDSDAQTLSLSGNVITISGSDSNVDLTTALGNVSGGGSYANSDVEAYLSGGTGIDFSSGEISLANTAVTAGTYGSSTQAPVITIDAQGRITSATTQAISGGGGGGGSGTSYEYFKLHYTSGGAIDTTQGTGGISNISSNIGNVTVNNSASNSCEIIVDFGGNYNYPPLAITAYGFSQSTSEYNIKGMIQSAINTTLKLDGSGNPHGSLSTANITMSLTRSETGSSSGFGQSSHAWIYFTMGG